MATLLVRNAHTLVTMDPARREIAGGGLFARDGFIEQVGPTAELPTEADQVVDASGMLVLPGLVNTHHHLYQTLTRAVPGAQDVGLFPWLKRLYPIWARMTPDDVGVATRVGLLELAHSGCTTVFDHQYLWPNGSRVGDQVAAAHELGVRFHASRGSMSLGESKGGLPPDSVVEDEDAILEDCLRAIAAYHDPSPGSMTQVVVAPCSPFSVTPDLMREAAALARDQKVRLHTHLAETMDEEHFCLETFGARPVPLRRGPGLGRARCLVRPRGVRRPGRDRPHGRRRHRGGSLPRPRTCASPPASPPLPAIWRPGCRWAWGWTGRPPTTAPTCWARPARPCCWPAWRRRRRSAEAPRWRPGPPWNWPPWAGRRCWGAPTSAPWNRGSAPTSSAST